MSVSNAMLGVPGRLLNPPSISYQKGNNSVRNPRGASWNLQGVKFVKPAELSRWSAMIIQEPNATVQPSTGKAIVEAFQNSAATYGMKTTPATLKLSDGGGAPIITLPREREGREWKSLVQIISPHMERLAKSGIRIVYVLLPGSDKAVYSAVKYCGDIKYGVGTVCSHTNKASAPGPRQAQYLANVALKFNLKLGGMNHLISLPADSQKTFDGKKTMLVCLECFFICARN